MMDEWALHQWTKDLARPHSVALVVDGVRDKPRQIGKSLVLIPLCATGLHEIAIVGLDADGKDLWCEPVSSGPYAVGEEVVFSLSDRITA